MPISIHHLIYISLWTNYNWRIQGKDRTQDKFTFHYELIITPLQFFRHFLEEIYISLWTNYNVNLWSDAWIKNEFTFHYELIITLEVSLQLYLPLIFTFHYELIITQKAIKLCIVFFEIYISLWTNYNFSVTVVCYLLN